MTRLAMLVLIRTWPRLLLVLISKATSVAGVRYLPANPRTDLWSKFRVRFKA